VEINKSALVVVDMQNGFLNEKSSHVIPAVVRTVEAWLEAGGSIVFTRYLNYPGSPFERLIRWSSLQTSPETDITRELSPFLDRAVAVVDKKIYSLFTSEGAALVKERGWTDLVFCGVNTDGCVLKSAVDAFEAGYVPWVLRDACASHAGDEVHRAGLLLTGRFIGKDQIVDTQPFLRENLLVAPAK
jgi:nicotinamidase-related amidase